MAEDFKSNSDAFAYLQRRGDRALDMLVEHYHRPDGHKEPMTWTIGQAAELVGRSPSTIREAEKRGEIPDPRSDDSKGRRLYTIEQIRAMQAHFGTSPAPKNGHRAITLALMNLKGGAQKTTISQHLAHYLAEKGYRVLAVDTDPQGSLTTLLTGKLADRDIENDTTLQPIYQMEREYINELSLLQTNWSNLDIVPANLDLTIAEWGLWNLTEEERESLERRAPSTEEAGWADHRPGLPIFYVLHHALEEMRNRYDVIIVDTPPSLSPFSMNCLFAADGLIMPVPMQMADMAAATSFFGMTAQVLDFFEAQTTQPKHYWFRKLLMVRANRDIASQSIEGMMRGLFTGHILQHSIVESTAVSRAAQQFRSLYEMTESDPAIKRARKSYDEAFAEIEELMRGAWREMSKAQARTRTRENQDVA